MDTTSPTSTNLAGLIRKYYKDTKSMVDLMDVVTFAESAVGLGLKLYPAQRFLLRVFYGLDLQDNLAEPIIIKDMFNEHIVHEFTSERDFLEFLYKEKRINMNYEGWDANRGLVNEAILVCGRRASKNVLTSIITVHQLYLLLSIPNPHEYFSILTSDTIGIVVVSNTEDSALRAYKSISNMVFKSRFFKPYVTQSSAKEGLWLMTDAFKDEQVAGVLHSTQGNVLVQASAPTGKVRGGSNIIVIMDEIAHFIDADTQGKPVQSDTDIYRALVPSTWGFVSPETGRGAGKSFIMSSPNGKRGLLYDFYKKSFDSTTTLMLNTPSNWLNINLAPDTLRRDYNSSEVGFRQEFMGEFIDATGNWISDLDRLFACFDVSSKNEMKQQYDGYHFAGVDLAFTHDRSVIAVCHCQYEKPQVQLEKLAYYDMMAQDGLYYIVDYIHILEPRKGMPIKPEFVLESLKAIYNRFKIYNGTSDQFSGEIFKSMIAKTSIRLDIENATMQNNSDRAVLMKQLIMDGRLIMPNLELVKLEFQALQETHSKGYVRVANDRGHDDIYSAVARAVELAHRFHKLQNERRVVSATRFIGGNVMRTSSRVAGTGLGKQKTTGNPMRDAMIGGRYSRAGM